MEWYKITQNSLHTAYITIKHQLNSASLWQSNSIKEGGHRTSHLTFGLLNIGVLNIGVLNIGVIVIVGCWSSNLYCFRVVNIMLCV